jgi:hypothetical protein
MKTIKVIKNFTANDKPYIIGDIIEDMSYNQIVKLNELGFIEPLKYEDLAIIKRELEKPKKIKEEKL